MRGVMGCGWRLLGSFNRAVMSSALRLLVMGKLLKRKRNINYASSPFAHDINPYYDQALNHQEEAVQFKTKA